jgi:hypothetical protein
MRATGFFHGGRFATLKDVINPIMINFSLSLIALIKFVLNGVNKTAVISLNCYPVLKTIEAE